MIIGNIDFRFKIETPKLKKDREKFDLRSLQEASDLASLFAFGRVCVGNGSFVGYEFNAQVYEFFSQLTGGLKAITNGIDDKAAIANLEAKYSFDLFKKKNGRFFYHQILMILMSSFLKILIPMM